LKQLQEIIVDKMKTNPGAREVLEQVDGEEVLDPDNVGSELSTLLDTIRSDFEHDVLTRRSGC
jgi:NurA-like 5'-3' nuclease